jgi:protoporphyrinogen oxidase
MSNKDLLKPVGILGGGIAGLSLAHFIKTESFILEKENILGGLSRSFRMNGICYDIGPHIIFSKNKEILDLHTSLIETNRIRRSNQIFYKGRYIKYPFENDLSKLPEDEKNYCVKEFLSNPYENYKPENMLQFFLKTFGEGITRTYLQPYNEKIWKFDPSFMDTQMVDRIPKPPKEDIIKSANGIETEGYLHQLYFHYPKSGGFQTLVEAYRQKTQDKAQTVTSVHIDKLYKRDKNWIVSTNKGVFETPLLVNTMPVHELFHYLEAPSEIEDSLQKMKYNSIHIVIVQVKKDNIGDHFALYFSEKDTIFHRLSKLNFLGPEYCLPDGGSTLQLEITFRPDSYLGQLKPEEVSQKAVEDLIKISLIKKEDITGVEVRTFPYAYVIYDLEHRKNTDAVLQYLRSIGIQSAGRFAQFEYLNSDQVAEKTKILATELNGML